jgi:hypothetical protein
MDNDAGRKDVEGGSGRAPLLARPWLAASILLLAAAGALLWLNRPDAGFLAATLGVSAWFYDVRAGLKRKHDLVRLGGRNWVPRDELDDVDDADSDDGDDDADGDGKSGDED